MATYSSIKAVKFGIMSPDSILGMSVSEIVDHGTDKGMDFRKRGTPFDPCLGTIRSDSAGCSTCNRGHTTDQGHMGHMEFAVPMYNPLFSPIKSSQGKFLLYILRMVCINCSANLLQDIDKDYYDLIVNNSAPGMVFNNIRQTFTKSQQKNVICPDCNMLQPKKYDFTEKSEIIATYKITAEIKDLVTSWIYNTSYEEVDDLKNVVEASIMRAFKNGIDKGDLAVFVIPRQHIYDTLCKISDDTVRMFGMDPKYSRPESMMFKYFPIPPLHVRPTVFRDTRSSEDDLTHIIRHLLTLNNKLRDKLASIKSGKSDTLEFSTFEPNNDNAFDFTYAVDSSITVLIQRIQGYINSYIMDSSGSQGMFKNSARYVSNFRMRYQPGNAASTKGRIRTNLSGKRTGIAMRSVIDGNSLLEIDEVGIPLRAAMKLTVCEIVNKENFDRLQRHVNNGRDKYPGALYMQRPGQSLIYLKGAPRHRKIQEGDLVHRHLCDGDIVFLNRQPSLHKLSMMGHRVHITDSKVIYLNIGACDPYGADFDGDEMHVYVPQSREAIEEVRNVAMVSKNFLRPSNSRSAIKLIQDGALGVYLLGINEYLPRQVILNIMATSKYIVAHWPKTIPDNGFDLLRLLFRRNYRLPRDKCNAKSIQSIAGRTYFDVSPEEALRFMSEVQFMSHNYIDYHGATIGARDLRVPESIELEIKRIVDQTRLECLALEREYAMREKSDIPYLTLAEELDNKINKIIGENIENFTNTILFPYCIKEYNGVHLAAIRAGSKGKKSDIQNMIAWIGQQHFKGSTRTPFKMNGHSIHPYYVIYDNSIEARGFIASNFSSGYTLSEAYHIGRAGRDSLVDTTHTTQTTGYFNRRIGKNCESVIVSGDFTIRRDNSEIVMTEFGFDGFDAQHIVRDEEIVSKYIVSKEEYENTFFGDIEEENKLLTECRDSVFKNFEGISFYRADSLTNLESITVFSPLSLAKTIEVSQIEIARKKTDKTVSSKVAFKMYIEAIENSMPIKKCVDVDHVSLGNFRDVYNSRMLVHHILYLPYLCTKSLANHKITKDQLSYILDKLVVNTLTSYAMPGKNIGIESAITIGEKSTQDALDSFHSAGSAASSSAVAMRELGISNIFEISTRASKYEREQAENSMVQKSRTKNKIPRSRLPYHKKRINVFLKNPESEKDIRTFMDTVRSVKLEDLIADTPDWYFDPDNTMFPEDSIIHEFYELKNGTVFEFESDIGSDHDIEGAEPGWATAVMGYVLRAELNVNDILEKNIDLNTFFSRMTSILNDPAYILEYEAPWSSVIIAHDLVTNSDKTIALFRIVPSFYTNNLLNLMDHALRSILNVYVTGPNRASRVSTEQSTMESVTIDPELGVKKIEIPYFVVAGVRIIDLISVPELNEIIDMEKIDTNDYIEYYDMLGCSAAAALMQRDAISLYGADSVSPRHLILVIENMTREGEILPLKRNGTELITTSTLAKASNEQPILNLVRGAIESSIDYTHNVSTAIITGTPFKTGTGYSSVVCKELGIASRDKEPVPRSVRDIEARIKADAYAELVDTRVVLEEIRRGFISEEQFLKNIG